MSGPMVRTRRRGFSLIELLTVIAIIATLAAILFPIFSSARRKSRQTACLSNLQQIGRAIEMYTNDHAGFIVPWCITNPDPDNPGISQAQQEEPGYVTTWDLSIQSYLKNKSVLTCRSNPVGGGTARAFAVARYTQKPYGTNFYGGYRDSIRAPTRTVLLFEKGQWEPGSWGDALGENVYQSHGPDYDPNDPEVSPMFHFRGKNFLFVDGHSKWFEAGQGPFAHQPTSGDDPGVCEVWGRAPAGDWPEVE